MEAVEEVFAKATHGPACSYCGTLLSDMGEFHPHSFCVLVKAGYIPFDVVDEARRYLGDPESKTWLHVTDRSVAKA